MDFGFGIFSDVTPYLFQRTHILRTLPKFEKVRFWRNIAKTVVLHAFPYMWARQDNTTKSEIKSSFRKMKPNCYSKRIAGLKADDRRMRCSRLAWGMRALGWTGAAFRTNVAGQDDFRVTGQQPRTTRQSSRQSLRLVGSEVRCGLLLEEYQYTNRLGRMGAWVCSSERLLNSASTNL